ncbi:RNAse III [Nitrospirillum amazonense]|uniref:Ribonuclease 3 n=1 Tax=Nitrospirillum amazonense TaxID=28077 RepID=A0A560FKE9_9PROT|nr:ribonuclease III [Nitrospirillum amazonense]TWB22079.1 RNAse III [Nitrospirillum amazonense]
MATSAGPLDTGGADIATLAEALGHTFTEARHLLEAVTHPSVAGIGRGPRAATGHYERLEFLGDRVLGLVIAQWLLERFPEENEGGLAKRHTALVRAEALAGVAETLDLGRYLRLAPGESDAGGRTKPAILADACEAVIGALYLDGGLDVAGAFIRKHWAGRIDAAEQPPVEPKTALQEWALARGLPLPVYEQVGRTGLDHEPVFTVRVAVQGKGSEAASGPSKRAAEKAAALEMLKRLG